MASIRNLTEAASNPTLTIKNINQWLRDIAGKAEAEQAISEMTLEYNLDLLEGEDPMTPTEMAEIMEEKVVVSGQSERKCEDCGCYIEEYDEKHIFCMNEEQHVDIVHRCSAKTCGAYKPKTGEVDILNRRNNLVHSTGVDWKLIRDSKENSSNFSEMTLTEYYMAKRGEL